MGKNKWVRRATQLLAFTLALLISGSPATADSWVPQWLSWESIEQKSSDQLIIFQSSRVLHGSRHLEWNTTGQLFSDKNRSLYCNNSFQRWGQGECVDSAIQRGATIHFQSTVSRCKSVSDFACVESVSITSLDKPYAKTEFVRETGSEDLMPAIDDILVPGNDGASVWRSDVTHEKGNEYLVGYDLTGYAEPGGRQPKYFRAEMFVAPVFRELYGAFVTCASKVRDVCHKVQDFSPGTKVELTFRAPKAMGGWFFGQVSGPNVTMTSINSRVNRITISGGAEVIEGLDLRTPGKGWSESHFGWQVGGIEAVEKSRAAAKDRSSGSYTRWGMIMAEQIMNENACLNQGDGVRGIVSTNAMAYSKGMPAFNNGQFEFTVAGMHYKPDGVTLVTGHYDFLLSSAVARCLYGFSKAPIYGTVSVISTGGEQKIATTSVAEKDGWIKIAAHNFTFSTNLIKAKLSQVKPKTITCIKPSNKALIKKVAGVNPKCPAGYKVKP